MRYILLAVAFLALVAGFLIGVLAERGAQPHHITTSGGLKP